MKNKTSELQMRAIFSPLLWNPPAVLRLFIDAVAVQGVFFFLAHFLLSTRLCNRYVFRKPSPSHQHHWDQVSRAVTRRIFAWRSAWTSPLAGLFAELSAWRRHKEEKSVRASFIGTEPKAFRFKEFPPPREPVFSWMKYFFMPPQTSAANVKSTKNETKDKQNLPNWIMNEGKALLVCQFRCRLQKQTRNMAKTMVPQHQRELRSFMSYDFSKQGSNVIIYPYQ